MLNLVALIYEKVLLLIIIQITYYPSTIRKVYKWLSKWKWVYLFEYFQSNGVRTCEYVQGGMEESVQ